MNCTGDPEKVMNHPTAGWKFNESRQTLSECRSTTERRDDDDRPASNGSVSLSPNRTASSGEEKDEEDVFPSVGESAVHDCSAKLQRAMVRT